MESYLIVAETQGQKLDALRKMMERDGKQYDVAFDSIAFVGMKASKGIVISADWISICKQYDNVIPYWYYAIISESNVVSYYKLIDFADSDSELSDYLDYIKCRYKIAFFFGNCQMASIKKIITKSNFIKDYILIDHPGIHLSTSYEKENGLNSTLMNKVDLFVCHNISSNNIFSSKLSTDSLRHLLSDACMTIIVTNLWYDGYFPLLTKLDDNLFLRPEVCPRTSVPMLLDYYKLNLSDEEIEYNLKALNIDSKVIIDKHNSAISRLREREEKCDVQASDFIERNYRVVRLFHTENHPIRELLIVVTNRLLNLLNYYPVIDPCIDVPDIDSIQLYIPPVVKKTLKLEFNDDYLYWIKSINPHPLSLLERIKFLRIFLKPDSRVKTYEWIYRLPKTLNLNSRINSNSNIEVISMSFTMNCGMIHLALRYRVKNIDSSRQLVKYSSEFSPISSYFTYSVSSFKMLRTLVSRGEVVMYDLPEPDVEYIIDSTWTVG